MKLPWNSICRTSLTLAGITVASSSATASAEPRPTQFETEFEIAPAPAVQTVNAEPAAAIIEQLAGPAVSDWEQAIGDYLDTLMEPDRTEAPLRPARPPAEREAAAAFEAALLVAFQPAPIELKVTELPPAHGDFTGWGGVLAEWTAERMALINYTLHAAAPVTEQAVGD
jgi:hypothetical protein